MFGTPMQVEIMELSIILLKLTTTKKKETDRRSNAKRTHKNIGNQFVALKSFSTTLLALTNAVERLYFNAKHLEHWKMIT